MPIYYVIMEDKPTAAFAFMAIWHIVKVYACDIDDTHIIWDREVAPLFDGGRRIQAFIVAREPDNPFKEKAVDSTSTGNLP